MKTRAIVSVILSILLISSTLVFGDEGPAWKTQGKKFSLYGNIPRHLQNSEKMDLLITFAERIFGEEIQKPIDIYLVPFGEEHEYPRLEILHKNLPSLSPQSTAKKRWEGTFFWPEYAIQIDPKVFHETYMLSVDGREYSIPGVGAYRIIHEISHVILSQRRKSPTKQHCEIADHVAESVVFLLTEEFVATELGITLPNISRMEQNGCIADILSTRYAQNGNSRFNSMEKQRGN